MSTALSVLLEVSDERTHQDAKWGQQNHLDGTGHDPTGFRTGLGADMPSADDARGACDFAFGLGRGAWRDILAEEVCEAMDAEPDSDHLRHELIQVAAVAVAWIECIDRRAGVAA